MKIVQVQTQAEAAGAQRVSDMVGEGLRARGHQVRTVFMYRKTDAYDADPHADFVLMQRPRGGLGYLRAIFGLVAYMRRERPDAVISYQHYGNIFGTIAGRLGGARRLIANQSGAPGTRGAMRIAAIIDKWMGRLGLYHASVVNSAWTEAQFAHYPTAYRERLRRIDHGVLAGSRRLGRTAAREAFGLPEDVPLAISTGRFTVVKNQAAIIEAVAAIPGLHLALAGAGPEEATLVQRAALYGMSERLHLVGEVPPGQIFDFLATGDVFVFASRTETFGLSVAEAAVAGLPVVANGLPVLREVLGNAAVYADAEQPGALADAMAQVVGDPRLAQRLGEAGRHLAERYSPAAMCAAYEALLTG